MVSLQPSSWRTVFVINDWMSEPYSFTPSDFQDGATTLSLRESKFLPDDFDPITRPSRPPPPAQLDTDGDHNLPLKCCLCLSRVTRRQTRCPEPATKW